MKVSKINGCFESFGKFQLKHRTACNDHHNPLCPVVVEELIPEMSQGEHSNVGVVAFAFGFSLMMALDVALG